MFLFVLAHLKLVDLFLNSLSLFVLLLLTTPFRFLFCPGTFTEGVYLLQNCRWLGDFLGWAYLFQFPLNKTQRPFYSLPWGNELEGAGFLSYVALWICVCPLVKMNYDAGVFLSPRRHSS